jgi:hypothetical protein
VLRTGVRHFDVPLLFAITQVIMQGSAEAFLVVGGRCTGRAHRCKAKQGRRGKTALMSYSYYYSSIVFGRRREGKKISLVTMAARCLLIVRQGRDCKSIMGAGLENSGLGGT